MQTYRKYYDELHILSSDGDYWVEGDDRTYFNILGGLLIPLDKKWLLQLGGEMNPSGATMGVGCMY